jgi:hypothetical protein
VSVSVSSLLRQIDGGTVASIHSMHTCLLRATTGMHLTGVYLAGVCLMGIHLMGIYLIGGTA